MLDEIQKPRSKEPSEELNLIAEKVVRSAFQVHVNIGPGLLERFYRDSLIIELKKRGLKVEKEVPIPIYYEGVLIEGYYILDIIVEDKLVIELKTVEELSKLHKAQLRTYLRLSGHHLGLLINFNSILIKDGIKRVVNDFYHDETEK